MIEAMKQALEALEELHRTGDTQVFDMCYAPKIIPALRQAIEQAEKQEPVAWQVMVEDEAMKEFPIKDMAHDWCVHQKLSGSSYAYWIRPLYTTPPHRKPLTEKRIEELYSFWVVDCQDIVGFARAVERTVKGEV